MEYKNLDKEALKEVIKSNAEMKGFELSDGWYNFGKDKMTKLALEIDEAEYISEEEEYDAKTEVEADDAALLEILRNIPKEKLMELLKPSEVKKPTLVKVKGKTSMKDRILAEPKVWVEVPEDELSGTNYITIMVQGVEFIYARSQAYEMPAPVAEVYKKSIKNNYAARKKMSRMEQLNM